MELVNLSWLFAYFMNATQAATPNVPRIINAGHLRYQTIKSDTTTKIVSQSPGMTEEGGRFKIHLDGRQLSFRYRSGVVLAGF